MTTPQRTVSDLSALKKRAVKLRLQKVSLSDITSITGLSKPTIIAAHKRFLQGGWVALESATRGRPKGAKGSRRLDMSTLLQQILATHKPYWDIDTATQWIKDTHGHPLSEKSCRRLLTEIGLIPHSTPDAASPQLIRQWLEKEAPEFVERTPALFVCSFRKLDKIAGTPSYQIICKNMKQRVSWTHGDGELSFSAILRFLDILIENSNKPVAIALKLPSPERFNEVQEWQLKRKDQVQLVPYEDLLKAAAAAQIHHNSENAQFKKTPPGKDMPLTHLQRLEAESIQIMREVVAETENPVMLYSIGKDSAVMLHIAMKAFYPSLPPFPLLHVDTRWKFQDMYAFRDKMVKDLGLQLITHINPEGVEKNINPFTHGSAIHTDIMKTEGLKQALNQYGFDAAFGGARRDEEKSRAKERVFSFRSADHRWDPKSQRPEIWKQYNARKHKGESIRVFPLSNWTELDIWQYIYLEGIPIVPLYYSAERPVVERDGTLIMVDDERMPLKEGEVPMMKKVRFRTLGCYPLTGAVESEADTLPAIIQEMLLTKTSERQGRVIDHDSAASMEKKKQEGYF